jgi:hypothetical protein
MKIPAKTVALANLNHWRAGQGAKIKANRPIEVYRACEFMAQRLAPYRDPLTLNKDEIATAIKRAVSHKRQAQHGPLRGLGEDEWWTQIEAICRAWGLEANRADWTVNTKAETQQEAA